MVSREEAKLKFGNEKLVMRDKILIGFKSGRSVYFADEVTVMADSIEYIEADSNKFEMTKRGSELLTISKKVVKLTTGLGTVDRDDVMYLSGIKGGTR